MTTQLDIVNGPSRENLFDSLRLGSVHCLLPVSFEIKGSKNNLILPQVLGLARVYCDPRMTEHLIWTISAEAEMPADFKEASVPMFQQYKVDMTYNTFRRDGKATLTRIEGKTTRF